MSISSLEHEVNQLTANTAEALKNPFLPANVRQAMGQAAYVIRSLTAEVLALRRQLSANGETINGQLLEMRRLIDGNAVTRPADLSTLRGVH